MHAILEICSGYQANRKIMLAPGQALRIGRTEWADVALADDGHLSSIHFAVRYDGRSCEVEDLDSRNGITVNGTPTLRAKLANGDTIVAGKTAFRIHLLAAEPVASPTGAAGAAVPPAPRTLRSARREVAHVRDDRRPYRQALQHEDPVVWQAALWAAVWAREPWLLDYCRSVATRPTVGDDELLRAFAILAPASDLALFQALALHRALGAFRWALLGIFGHPRLIPLLIRAFREDPLEAAAAGKAFWRMTGLEVWAEQSSNRSSPGGERAAATAAAAAEGDEEFTEPLQAPDAARALAAWEHELKHLHGATRICRGQDISHQLGLEALATFDLEARWHTAVRTHYHGLWTGTPMHVAGYPRRSASR